MHLAIGAKLSRVDIDLKMYEPGASVDLVGAYLVDGKRHADLHPTQFHLAPHCRSDLFTKGVIKDSARSVYYGYIRVAEGAQRTDAYQTNRNLLLSPSARADSIPNLEIKANDVRCSHGASVSSVSAEDMFYLMARGLSRNSAEELLVEGFLSELLTRVKHPVLHGWLSALVTEQLARRG
jgi:Fe-S cluster assembly protein SufD